MMTTHDLIQARHALRLTQAQLAKALGLTRNTIGRHESGHRPIPLIIELAVSQLKAQQEVTL